MPTHRATHGHEPRRAFDPDRDAILPVDDCWLVDARLMSQRGAGSDEMEFQAAYARSVDRLAEQGFGCVPDPAAGDRCPDELVATCIVYRVDPHQHVRGGDPGRELHLRMVCAMARSDGAFVGSELAVAMEVAERIAISSVERRRLRAIVHELFVNPAERRDPFMHLLAMPRAQALDVLETITTTAWADGLLRQAERCMLERVHQLLGLPAELVDARGESARYVDDASEAA
jgi:tellurite resistance protein